MPAMVWVLLAVIILCMAIPYGKLYLWDRRRRRPGSNPPAQVPPGVNPPHPTPGTSGPEQ